MENFKNWYIEYCREEFGFDEDETESEFNRTYEMNGELGLVFCTFEDDNDEERQIQISVTLRKPSELVYVDGELVYSRSYNSFDELLSGYDGASFEDIYNWALERCVPSEVMHGVH